MLLATLLTWSVIVAAAGAAFFYTGGKAYAHPGGLSADGCHYCRTNCDKWGVPWNQRHCHKGPNSGSVQAPPAASRTLPPAPAANLLEPSKSPYSDPLPPPQ